MTPHQKLIAVIASSIILLVVCELVRRRRLREEYSMLWLASGVVLLLVSMHGNLIHWLAKLLGIDHPAYGLFVLALFMGFVLAIHFTIVLSKLTAQNWRLIQEVGLLKTEIESLQNRSEKEMANAAGNQAQ